VASTKAPITTATSVLPVNHLPFVFNQLGDVERLLCGASSRFLAAASSNLPMGPPCGVALFGILHLMHLTPAITNLGSPQIRT
jgi:hypothetical protein